jgi:cysteinyl-tRNA synthetase
MQVEALKARHAELVSASISASAVPEREEKWTLEAQLSSLKQVQGDDLGKLRPFLEKFDIAISDDLNTPLALTALEEALAIKKVDPAEKLRMLEAMDAVLGLDIGRLSRADLRLRPADAQIAEAEIDAALARRQEARAAKDFAQSDAIRDQLAAKGVEVMDGDPLGWEWKL